jgi:hypothetical protein
MKKSINLWAFPYPGQWAPKECLENAKDAGFEGIELNLDREGELSVRGEAARLVEIRDSTTSNDGARQRVYQCETWAQPGIVPAAPDARRSPSKQPPPLNFSAAPMPAEVVHRGTADLVHNCFDGCMVTFHIEPGGTLT